MEFQQSGFNVKSAVFCVHAQDRWRDGLALSIYPKGMLYHSDTFIEGQQALNLSRGQQQDFFRFHAALPAGALALSKNGDRSLPGAASKGSSPRRNRRAVWGPLNTTVPSCTRSIEPSRKPITGSSFSSRNCRIRS